ncbi:hypothetical protein NLG97_g11191 [Lecanicillium saksenae]|uniref:Uncharacterized protein n=1 Tax=Lecanicillium saksenae TaxID=468837 RepID=A0ACC1QCS3_9HYPO|nr:hypothetical protein NLG97_g11191 [Lecanicillium saksenae]
MRVRYETCLGSKMICAASASRERLTASLAAADGAVAGISEVAANVADLGVEEALAGKVATVEVLGAPEAAGRDGAELRAVGDGGGGCGAPAPVSGAMDILGERPNERAKKRLMKLNGIAV